MGTAALFLLLLDAIILFPSPSQVRVDLATGMTVLVLVMIAAIWRRNTQLERLAENAARTK